MGILPPPKAFGLPYDSWRDGQEKAIMEVTDTKRRFVAQACPTGFGKSLVYVAAALLNGGRTVFLTSTKGLQSQLARDFGKSPGLCDIRGKNAYPCVASEGTTSCENGPCAAGVKCGMRGLCVYYNKLKDAQHSDLVVTNYACWMYLQKYGEGIGKFDMMVCDEAHSAPDMVGSFLQAEFSVTRPVEKAIIPAQSEKKTANGWVGWAKHHHTLIELEIADMRDAGSPNKKDLRRLLYLGRTLEKLGKVLKMDESWVVDRSRDKLLFSPVWPGEHAEGALFKCIDKVNLVSATLRPKTLKLLGINGGFDFSEYDHPFPLENRRLIHIPTVRMNHRTTEVGLRTWLDRIDQIVRSRGESKGIIHTVSYDRRNRIMSRSKNRERLVSHERRGAEDAVKNFKVDDRPRVLVSPSLAIGWDFPYDECRFQIISKLAYPDTRGALMRRRVEQDQEYTSYLAMQELIQACGRGVRAKDDWCENFVIDDNVLWFLKRYSIFAPKWFLDGFVSTRTIPRPPMVT